jgi:PAS domain S-box-containing protein
MGEEEELGPDADDPRGSSPEGDPEHTADLLAEAERIAQIGSYEWLPDVPELRWTDNLFRLFGLEPGEIAPNAEFWLERVHPDDRPQVDEAMAAWERDRVGEATLNYRFIRADGAMRHFRSRSAMVNGHDGQLRIIGPIQDITDQRRAERDLAAHVAVSEALSSWETLEQGARELLRGIAVAMDFEVGVLWLLEDRVLRPRVIWQSGRMEGSEFEAVTAQLGFPRGAGLPGNAWESQHPVSVRRADDTNGFERRGATNLSGAVAFPATHDGETVAVLEFHSREDDQLTERSMRSFAGLGSEVGRFLARRRGELGRARALTPRELEVLQLAADGSSGRKIAERLVVSPSTIKTHFDHIYEKLGVSDRPAAVAAALRLGLIE